MSLINSIRNALFGPKVDYAELVLDGALIIDVRSPEEFKLGHSVDAQNIPLGELTSRVGELGDKTVILVCQSGMRAASAKATLRSKGVKCYNAGSWTKLA